MAVAIPWAGANMDGRKRLSVQAVVFWAVSVLAYAGPVSATDPVLSKRPAAALVLSNGPADKAICDHFLASLKDADATLRSLSYQTETINQFKRLHPTDGNGYLTLDITPAVPEFLRGNNYKRFDWPESKAFAFEGDADVPHYIDMVASRDELKKIIGEKNAAQLQALGIAMTDFVAENLPKAERDRLEQQNLEVILDLAELRVGVGTGSNVHLDWQPREGMVMIVPIYGNRTTVFEGGTTASVKTEPGHYYASLITGYERWANFHRFNCQGDCRPGTFMPRQGGQFNGVVVPDGAKAFIRTRGRDVPPICFQKRRDFCQPSTVRARGPEWCWYLTSRIGAPALPMSHNFCLRTSTKPASRGPARSRRLARSTT